LAIYSRSFRTKTNPVVVHNYLMVFRIKTKLKLEAK
jgi:hypothetical protein